MMQRPLLLLAALLLAGCADAPDESAPLSNSSADNGTPIDENVTSPESSAMCVEGAEDCDDTPEPPPYTMA